MEVTTQQTMQSAKTDFAAALNQYSKYSHGRSMRQFCEDEGYDYNEFCRYAREGAKERGIQTEPTTFIEVRPESEFAERNGDESLIKEIRIRFKSGIVMSYRGDNVDTLMSLVNRIKQSR